VSGFALTEPEVGSDPANMRTTAVPTEDGSHFIINGEKLWCTNGAIADLLVVMARTPGRRVNGQERKEITAFIVEKDMPGVELIHRCDFMGLKGIQNGYLRFTNVKVPRENILWGEGQGLKLALITLNTGRLTVPAACAGMAKWCLAVARRWAKERVQWGQAVGKHEAVAAKLARIAAFTFVIESVAGLTSGWADRGQQDIRLEAAIAKLLASELVWQVIDDTVQVRGGRGYETAPSLRARGEKGYAVERMMRDGRINMIIEGTSEIMRLFIAREALDPHLRTAGDLIKAKAPWARKVWSALRAGSFYAWWYPTRYFPSLPRGIGGVTPPLLDHLDYLETVSRRLARAIFHSLVKYQAGLEKRQQILGRLVDIGVEALAMTAACARADALVKKNPADPSPVELADFFCREARLRIEDHFKRLNRHNDRQGYRVGQDVLEAKMAWLEQGIIWQEEPVSRPPVSAAE